MELLISIIMIGFLIVSIIATIYLKFPQFKVFSKIRYFNKNNNNNNMKDAFLVTLATNIGTGNLVGVTSGIILGGPGVIIWMWIFGFFSSSLSYLENYYAVKYREKFGDEYRGGACFYILKGLNAPIVSIIFAIFLLLTKVTKIKSIVIRKIYRLFFITSIIIGTIFSTFTTMKLVDFGLIALGLINIIAFYKLVKKGLPIQQEK